MSKQNERNGIWRFLLILVLACSCLGIAFARPVQAASKPKLSSKKASIVIGGKTSIKVKNKPSGAKITYASKNKKIAKVSKKGVVTGVKAGTTNVVVTVKKGKSKTKLTFQVKVKKPSLKKKKLSLNEGQSASLAFYYKPAKASKTKYSWSTSNKKVATVKNGKVTAKKEGTATIRVKVFRSGAFSYTLACKVTVSKICKVTFKPNGGSSVASQKIKKGKKAVKPTDPVREDYEFLGWFTQKTGGKAYVFSSVVKNDLVLYAHWKKVIANVRFESNGGSEVAAQKVKMSEKAQKPDDPFLAGRTFSGWYEDSKLTKAYDFSKPVTKDMTLYGKWEYGVNLSGPDSQEVSFERFGADLRDILVGQETDVTFTAELNSVYPVTQEVAVYSEQDEKITVLRDDGEGADEMAGDGIFTGTASLIETEKKEVVYCAKVLDLVSEGISVSFYTQIPEEEFEKVQEAVDSVQQMDSVQEVTGYLAKNPDVAHYVVSEDRNTVIFRSNMGITCIWENGKAKNESVQTKAATYDADDNLTLSSSGFTYDDIRDAVTDPDAVYSASHTKKNICVLRPFHGTQFRYDDFSEAGGILSAALGGSFDVYDDEDAYADRFKNFGSYGVVLVDSHGTLSNVTNSAWTIVDTDPYMLTGERYSSWQSFTSSDWETERIVVVADNSLFGGMLGGGIVAVGGKFFEHYYESGSLRGSMFFLGTCYSMYNNTIAQALIDKGASVVYGYSNVVSTKYCNDTLFECVLNQLLRNASTGQEAFDRTCTACGAEDPHISGTYFRTLGNSAYTLVDDKGSVVGTVRDYESGASIANAKIVFKNENGFTVKRIKAETDGSFSQKLDEGTYTVEVSAYGYLSETIEGIEVTSNRKTYLEDSLMLHPEESTRISGKVVNALNGYPVEGAVITFRTNHNNLAGNLIEYLSGNAVRIRTDAYGEYLFEQLPVGYYTMEVSCDGYVTATRNIVASKEAINQDVALTPEMNADEMRIILTWGSDPRDLDSHLTGPTASGGSFHIYYMDKTQYEDGTLMADLDRDDTDSYGPETTTIHETIDGTYRFYIYRYAGSGSISTSGAQVKVYKGNDLVATYNAPTDQGTGDYWNVFEFDGLTRQIRTVNTISD